MSSDDDVKQLFPHLGEKNYNQWVGNFIALAMKKNLYSILSGTETKPKDALATALPGDQSDYDRCRKQLAGELFLSLEDDQKTHVQDCFDDPVKMWTKLESVHLQKKPGMRFNAWEEFFSIHMEENESLSALMTKIEAAMQKIKNLRPTPFSLDDLDNELVSMTMIRALPSSYSSFASSLQLLEKLELSTLQAAFINEEALRTRSSTLGTTAQVASTPSNAICQFCSLLGHV